jgi:hypothetical protein
MLQSCEEHLREQVTSAAVGGVPPSMEGSQSSTLRMVFTRPMNTACCAGPAELPIRIRSCNARRTPTLHI